MRRDEDKVKMAKQVSRAGMRRQYSAVQGSKSPDGLFQLRHMGLRTKGESKAETWIRPQEKTLKTGPVGVRLTLTLS